MLPLLAVYSALAAPVPTLPTGTVSAHAPAPSDEVLHGVDTGETVPISVELGILTEVGPDNWNEVFAHLAADRRWRVNEYRNAIVAFRRTEDRTGYWTTPRDGIHRGEGIDRVALRFTGWDVGLPWITSPLVTRIDADAAAAELVLFQLPGDERYGTALAVEGLDLSVEVLEIAPTRTTRATLRMQDVGLDLRRILDHGAYAQGSDEAADVRLHRRDAGVIELEAQVNPGLAGWTWLRILDRHGEPWEEEAIAIDTREAIGWSDDPLETYAMQAIFHVPSGPSFRGVAEIWTQPADRPEPVLVHEQRIRVRP